VNRIKAFSTIKRILVYGIVVVAAVGLLASSNTDVQRLMRGQDLLSTVFRHLLTEYIDDIPPDELLRAAIKGMFSVVDPYAEFIEERGSTELDILSRGVYGGIGIKVLTYKGKHFVSYIYDSVRSNSVLRIGDEIVAVDSVVVADGRTKDLRELLRGTPGSTVQLSIRRPGIDESIQLTVLRREIEVPPVTYSALLDDDIAYIKIARFTRSAADSVRTHFNALSRDRAPAGIILDLRNNPGGLLESAVSVLGQLLPVETHVVTMKAREGRILREYRTPASPFAEHLPLVVLVNRRSASASEIVAGAIQDLDRGVILGDRTFGKGLVQTVMRMNYRTALKLTTSRYYLPSGRCIQRFTYREGKAEVDSSNAIFNTLHLTRQVRESVGIMPDRLMTEDSLSTFLRCLMANHAIFRFASDPDNLSGDGEPPMIDKRMQHSFANWIEKDQQCVEGELRTHYNTLLEKAAEYSLDKRAMSKLRSLEQDMRLNPAQEVQRHWEWIKRELELEFALQHFGERERLRAAIPYDEQLQTALDIIHDEHRYQATLESGPSY